MKKKSFVNVFPEIVRIPIRSEYFMTSLTQIGDWCTLNQIDAIWKNSWSDDKGTWLSYEIHDEQQRMLFLLTWG